MKKYNSSDTLVVSKIIMPSDINLRSSKVISRSNRGHVYKFPSLKCNRIVEAESGLEYDRVVLPENKHQLRRLSPREKGHLECRLNAMQGIIAKVKSLREHYERKLSFGSTSKGVNEISNKSTQKTNQQYERPILTVITDSLTNQIVNFHIGFEPLCAKKVKQIITNSKVPKNSVRKMSRQKKEQTIFHGIPLNFACDNGGEYRRSTLDLVVNSLQLDLYLNKAK